ncbi:universal stress protein [Vagococcus xieshaowenii]|uniref:Universal stress protein n=1 Tax=Vagococcus xieshaowenii TaxID=2562451 RepID=A0AAJ5EF79_9ENTE|nr:universal stress protein [Vagococcus xieshaowenii]QCA29027.1 universal stress protein [Vagococcus xieshaowenii]TFZ40997.1 universal stress protein [Vagococcus xieshaowenii]
MLLQEYKTILVGIDGSDQAFQAFQKAIAVAKRNDAKVVLAHIIESRLFGNTGYALTSADIIEVEKDRSKTMLQDYVEYANKQGFTNLETVLTFGTPKYVMTEELPEKYDVDLIMIGQSGLNAVERVIIGSVSEYVVRHAKCDVLIVRSDKDIKSKKN